MLVCFGLGDLFHSTKMGLQTTSVEPLSFIWLCASLRERKKWLCIITNQPYDLKKKGKNVGNCFLCRALKREQERGGGDGGGGRHFWPQLINRTLFRLACTHYLFTGAFSQSEGNMFQHLVGVGVGGGGSGREKEGWWWKEREKRWDELLPGVGRCHGVPSADSIVAQRTHRWLNAKGRAFSLWRKRL